MKKSKLISLLATFSEAEFRQFKEFVASPYFNKNDDLPRFASYLEGCAPEFADARLDKEAVHAALFPGVPFDGKQMAYLMNYLLKLAEHFLAIQHYEGQEHLVDYHMLRSFVNRRLDKHFNFQLAKTKEKLAAAEGQNSEYFFFEYQISELSGDFNVLQGNRKFDPSFQSASDSLDDFYFINKLKFGCEMLNRQKIFSTDYQLNFLEEVVGYLSRRPELPPITRLLLQTYHTMENPVSESHFQELMALLRTYSRQVDQEELQWIYVLAINHSVRNISQGLPEYIPIALELYLEGIRSRALFENNQLMHSRFTNVVKLALMLERYDMIEAFINTYSPYLHPNGREDALHYNLAELYYHRRDFDRVLDHLNQLQFSDIQYHLGSRVILIKTYYELDEVESLLSLLASFSVFLRRNQKIATPLKKRYLNFCNLLHHVMRRDPKKRERLGRQINTVQPLAERAWLQEIFEGSVRRAG